ncbi:glycosyltransferase [Actinomadura xylanilytica]|uniref:glycosyltransferase n=1 Tax=Actinomadura xylanilytica TaxID=887459 RepID=UPI00255A7754|nr:glycosyltransferase [Actinomadura xylanilytica]MDL4774235.1 glycosyltransferase [Actinomadura xylanilytica]
MSRFLFTVPPLTGHINPTAAVGAELTRRGHEVAWAGHRGMLEPLLPTGARVLPVTDDALDRLLREERLALRGAAALKSLWEEFIVPLGQAMLPDVEAAVATFAPDVLVADQQAIAGPVAARRAGITWATSASTPAEVLKPLAGMPKVEAWISSLMADFQAGSGLAEAVDLRFSDRLTLVFTTGALVGDVSRFPGHWIFAGPALAGRPDRGTFPWDWLDSHRRVLVSLGTLNGLVGERFYRVAVEALADLGEDLQAIIVAPPGMLTEPPPHVLVTDHVPQLALLPHLDAVVSHGGHNTVSETLAHGLPLVVCPIRDDQPIIADQVVAAGAGERVRFGRVRADDLRAALLAVLDVPAYRAAAQRVRDSFAAAGGAATAADHLEKLS